MIFDLFNQNSLLSHLSSSCQLAHLALMQYFPMPPSLAAATFSDVQLFSSSCDFSCSVHLLHVVLDRSPILLPPGCRVFAVVHTIVVHGQFISTFLV